ncbi:hypothetical protein NZT89_001726 [Campylobacter upsaliensis]|uniref:hypothetical protein n=1 Tax=Campylobacter upsaliensis TaxID=28080 RepID=UPI00127BAC4E|nr:hypothetical protein [Campylobacter upsaliensis]EAH5552983.1 hypothetical protein [Campylobacter upsaliensis]EAH5676767.1 hypothetical protein [Campylobacter upsaliensis]EAH5904182.1 hypothetical protein [Campylobacter upsaliensis]EAH8208521.1 hypothetical protein [Campylobacter upsaliensis]EAI8514930.1 hypothetical protein [Campylobacter upsaliensis]
MFANIEINARDLTGFDSQDILDMYLKLEQDKRENLLRNIVWALDNDEAEDLMREINNYLRYKNPKSSIKKR